MKSREYHRRNVLHFKQFKHFKWPSAAKGVHGPIEREGEEGEGEGEGEGERGGEREARREGEFDDVIDIFREIFRGKMRIFDVGIPCDSPLFPWIGETVGELTCD